MLELFITILLFVIVTEAITELVVKSELFEPLRKYCFESKYWLFNFIHRILDCGYCFSVWAGFFVVILNYVTSYFIVDIFMLGIVVHRLSNVLHFLIDKLYKK